MEFITREVMEATWLEVGALEPDEARLRQKQCGKLQQELSGFVIGFTSDLRADVVGLALYIHLVLLQAFRQAPAKVRKVKAKKIERAWEANRDVVQHLRSLDVEPHSLPVSSEITSEPAALQYVVDALTEKGEDPVPLSQDEFWRLLRVLKTVVDCMPDACRG